MSNIKMLVSTFLFFSSLMVIQAQDPDLPSEEVEVIKDFDARLEDTEKVSVKPELPPLDDNPRDLTYTLPTKTMTVEYPPPSIRPIAMKRDKVTPGYNGFLKLGYGIPNSLYGEGGYHFNYPDKLDVGLHLKHHSANRKKVEHQRFAETSGLLDATYYFDQGFGVGGELGYSRDVVHFYGYDHDLESFLRDEVKQHFNILDAKLRFFNAQRTEGDINYEVSTDFYRMADNFASKETGIDVTLAGTKWFAETHPLTVKIGTDFTWFKDVTTSKLNNFYFEPSFTYHGRGFKAIAGLNLVSNDDEFNFFPILEASLNVLGSAVAVYAGWKGDLQKNTFRSLSDYNPYIFSRGLDIRNTRYHFYYGGVKGNIKNVEYRAEVGYKRTRDLALFLNDAVDTKRFNVLYDTVNIFVVQGNISAEVIKGLQITASLGTNFYKPKTEDKAWHLPALETNVALRYLTMKDKLLLKAELFVENGVPYLTEQNVQENLNGLFDISLGAEYWFSKNFGAFFDVYNLANNRRQRYYKYPTFGVNILGGVTARF